MGQTPSGIWERGKSAGNNGVQAAQPPMPIFAKQKAIPAESGSPSLSIGTQDKDVAKPNALDQSGDNNEREKYHR
jgi:hypothetical protein